MDLKKTNIQRHLWSIPGEKPSRLTLLQASFVLTKKEKDVFVDVVRRLKTPTYYVGQLQKIVYVDEKLKELKSQHYHVLM